MVYENISPPQPFLHYLNKDNKKNGTDAAERVKKANLFAFFRAARKKSLHNGVKTENGKRKTESGKRKTEN